MLAPQRQAHILEVVRRAGGVRVSEIVRELGVSDMTVRRDLEALAARGLLAKVHGGATAILTASTREPTLAAKSTRQRVEKEAIAALAATLVNPGTAIGISAGTTTYALTRWLVDVPGLTVVTNSVQVADLLHQGAGTDQTVVLTGGVRTASDALVGPFAVAAVRSLHVDLVFMGVYGMDPHSGFTTPNMLEAETDRALVEAARRLVVLADHTKWGVVGISSIARLDEADVLVTDDRLDPGAQAVLAEHVGDLMLARVVSPSPTGWADPKELR